MNTESMEGVSMEEDEESCDIRQLHCSHYECWAKLGLVSETLDVRKFSLPGGV